MNTSIASRAALLALSALVTLAVFSGNDALAGRSYRVALEAQPTSVAVQHVVVVGHRNG